MIIGLDARLFGSKHRGIGRYTQKLIENLEKIDSQNQYFIFLAKDGFDVYQPKNQNFKKVLADFPVYGFKEQLVFPSLIKKFQLDLMHFTHFNAPIFFRGRFIVTIHDLIISHYPDSRATTKGLLVYQIKLFLYRLVMNSTAKRAEKILTVSEFTKNDIASLLKINPEKIKVIYEGADEEQVSPQDCQKFLGNLKVGDNFIFYVGSAYPHKNLENLISAFKILAEKNQSFQLVLAGKIDFFYERLKELAKSQGQTLAGKIIFTGYVNENQLACLYQKAKLYVFPSLIEGFGLPPLEAQGHSLAVASSSATCLPEILGDGAIYFDPSQIGDMAEKITTVLDNKNLRQELISKGLENTKRFSWDKCARETLKIYNGE